jgi:hypothetical protein
MHKEGEGRSINLRMIAAWKMMGKHEFSSDRSFKDNVIAENNTIIFSMYVLKISFTYGK